MSWKLGQDSAYKLIVWFIDGNVRTLYSIDWRHKFSKQKDAQLGLNRYYKKIQEWGNRAETVEIYINNYGSKSGDLIERYHQGIKQNPLVV